MSVLYISRCVIYFDELYILAPYIYIYIYIGDLYISMCYAPTCVIYFGALYISLHSISRCLIYLDTVYFPVLYIFSVRYIFRCVIYLSALYIPVPYIYWCLIHRNIYIQLRTSWNWQIYRSRSAPFRSVPLRSRSIPLIKRSLNHNIGIAFFRSAQIERSIHVIGFVRS